MPSGSYRRRLIVITILHKKSVRALRFARSTNGGSGLSGKVERANVQKPHAEYDYNTTKALTRLWLVYIHIRKTSTICLILDFTIEIFQISVCQERALVNAFHYVFRHSPKP